MVSPAVVVDLPHIVLVTHTGPGPGAEDDVVAAGDDDEGLTDLESQINANVAFHQFKNLDTAVRSCRIYKRRMVAFAMPIHCH